MNPIHSNKLPEPPYFAVIFASQRTDDDVTGYAAMAERMARLAEDQPGYLGIDSVRGADGTGITVSYWEDLESIERWRCHAEHLVAQQLGRTRWYRRFAVRIARVERAYESL